MAVLLRAQGHLADAEPLHREALEGRRQTLGDRHPDTLTSLESVIGLLMAQDKRFQAKRVLRIAQDGRRSSLRSGHPATMRSISYLANMLDVGGKPEKAKAVRRVRCLDVSGSGSGNGGRQAAMCANCRAIEPVGGGIKFNICTRCQVARYCGRECQKSH